VIDPVIALIGAKALYLLYAWLIGAVVSSWLSERKGYGERPGLATGMLTSLLGIVIWLAFPAKADSKWKLVGAFPWSKGSGMTLAEARAELAESGAGSGGPTGSGGAGAKQAKAEDPPAEPPHVSP
jgi:hypothetical protein